ncbi:MAG: FliM/FliN family flagellar motor switch protein [Pseudomonadota bacterium]
MNLAQTFTPARPLAQHCSELTERGPRPEQRAEYLAGWRRDVAREVAQDLADLLSGTKLEAKLSEAEMMRGSAVFEKIGAVAANSLLRCGSGDQTVLLSFSVDTAIALTDRSFGGSGEIAPDGATSLPRSAALLIEQASRTIARSIARVSAGGGAIGEVEGDVIIRSESASRLKPFAPSNSCALFTLTLTTPEAISWEAIIAMHSERLDSLLPGLGSPVTAGEGGDDNGALEAIMGDIPLPMKAVLAEIDLSLGQLNRLAPGDQIPLAVTRDIPLRIGARAIASGSLGTKEDRMALKLTGVTHEGLSA